jgi:hypothetical protein
MREIALSYPVAAQLLAVSLLGVASAANAGAEEFLALQASAPGAFSYARLSDIQVFLDASPTRCSVFLTNGQEIKAFQKCAAITASIDHQGLVTLPTKFGSVLLAPGFVSSLVSIGNGECRLNLRNSVWIPVAQACSEALQALGTSAYKR